MEINLIWVILGVFLILGGTVKALGGLRPFVRHTSIVMVFFAPLVVVAESLLFLMFWENLGSGPGENRGEQFLGLATGGLIYGSLILFPIVFLGGLVIGILSGFCCFIAAKCGWLNRSHWIAIFALVFGCAQVGVIVWHAMPILPVGMCVMPFAFTAIGGIIGSILHRVWEKAYPTSPPSADLPPIPTPTLPSEPLTVGRSDVS